MDSRMIFPLCLSRKTVTEADCGKIRIGGQSVEIFSPANLKTSKNGGNALPQSRKITAAQLRQLGQRRGFASVRETPLKGGSPDK
jgi:hypothetical protein